MTYTNKPKNKTFHLQHQALVDKLENSVIFAGLPSGFIKYGNMGNLDLLADGYFMCVIPGMQAAYFCPNTYDGTCLSADILGMLHEIAFRGVGIGLHTPAGCNWLVFDTDQYREICQLYGYEEDEFRIYPPDE